MLQTRTLTLIAIIAAVVLFRFLPHPPNVSPIAAMALFGGAYFMDRKLAFVMPFAALLISDLIIGLHDTMLFVYGAFAITVMIGLWIQTRISATTVAGAAVSSSILFYLITNFGVWMTGTHAYSMDMNGLMQAYTAGLPFLQNSLLGNLFFVTIMFGGYELLKRYRPEMVRA